MKKLLLIILLPLQLFATQRYISPTGNDTTGTGSYASPYRSLNKVWSYASAGDTVYLLTGTYYFSVNQILSGKNGTSGNLIKLWAYPNARPILNRTASYPGNIGIQFSGNYVHWRDIEITGYWQRNVTEKTSYGLYVHSAGNCIFERLKIHDNGMGCAMRGDGATGYPAVLNGNLILNCDFYANKDPYSSTPYNNSDGLEFCYVFDTTAVNTIRGCRFYWNTDDGIDLWYNDGTVIIENCWSFLNGYIPYTMDSIEFDGYHSGNGFKLGQNHVDLGYRSKHRFIYNCLSVYNYGTGFTHNSARCGMTLYNNTAYNNKARGIDINNTNYKSSLRNNIAYLNMELSLFTAASDSFSDHNNFTKYGGNNSSYNVTSADFVTDTTGLMSARKSDGSLPDITLMHLVKGSDLIDTGIDVGRTYVGTAPDLGYWEYYVPSVVVVPPPQKGLNSTYTGKVINYVSKILRR